METRQERRVSCAKRLQRRPSDAEAKSLLEMINRGVTAPSNVAATAAASASPTAAEASRAFPSSASSGTTTRLYRQLELQINNLNQQRLPK